MANGIMTGDGTKTNPFTVMDGYDFNALRNISSSNTDFKYIELSADINLSVYPIFTPIPEAFFNIDGKGHMITEINIIVAGYNAGLFALLSTNEFIKDLVIEGEIACNYSSPDVGSLCGTVSLYNGAVVSNVESYFSVSCTSSSGITIGGLFGRVTVEDGGCAIRECAFKGSILSSSSASGTVYTMIIGGLFAELYSGDPESEHLFLVEKCITQVNYSVNNKLSMRMGGIFGSVSHPYNTSSECFQIVVSKCVAKIAMRFIHTAAITENTHRVAGIVGYGGYYYGQVTSVEKCVAFIDMYWTHQYPIFAFRMGGLLYSGTDSRQTFTINQGYAVMRMINPDGLPWTGCIENLGSITYKPSTTPVIQVIDAFFDKEIFAQYYDGVFEEAHGLTTAELKDMVFLKLKGWEFDG